MLKRSWRNLKRRLRPARGGTEPAQEPMAPSFDPQWYLAQYPDVAAAGMDPWLHYCRHGRAEGRLPRCNRALAWEHHLWRGAESVMMPRLAGLTDDAEATPEERGHARWALARWYGFRGEWAKVVDYLMPEERLVALPDHPGPGLLALEALCRLAEAKGVESPIRRTAAKAGSYNTSGGPNPVGDTESPAEAGSYSGLGGNAPAMGAGVSRLRQVLEELQRRFPDQADTYLAEANAQWVLGDDSARLAAINALFAKHDLREVRLGDAGRPLSLDNLDPLPLTSHASRAEPHASLLTGEAPPLVSVIVPIYNARATIVTALRSLFAQTWRPLEIIVVDDASQDDSLAVIEALGDACPEGVTLRVLRHTENRGAYAARNTGVAEARGELITTHDSDDWSHPEKLAIQAQALLEDAGSLGCFSAWARCRDKLSFVSWLTAEGWVYRNLSSLMVRRRVIETLGYWDEVRVNADTEYHQRLVAAFGDGVIIDALPEVPLAFGRVEASSLTHRGATHLVTQFAGVRHDYMASARRWHASATTPEALYLPARPQGRAFAAPVALLRQAAPVRHPHPLDALQASGLFDGGWYLRTHLDLQSALIDPLSHYWEGGAAEGRDPGPHFSSSPGGLSRGGGSGHQPAMALPA